MDKSSTRSSQHPWHPGVSHPRIPCRSLLTLKILGDLASAWKNGSRRQHVRPDSNIPWAASDTQSAPAVSLPAPPSGPPLTAHTPEATLHTPQTPMYRVCLPGKPHVLPTLTGPGLMPRVLFMVYGVLMNTASGRRAENLNQMGSFKMGH